MKLIDADKLIAEIERRLKILEPHKDTFESAAACRQELIWMKDFVTSLQQEQPDGLDEAAENYAWSLNEQFGGIEVGTSMESFKAGAEWQKEQMMKEAVEGKMGFVSIMLNYPNFGEKFKEGDRVKLVVLKSEEK